MKKLDSISKEDQIAKWEDICRKDSHLPPDERWTDEDENALKEVKDKLGDWGHYAWAFAAENGKKESLH